VSHTDPSERAPHGDAASSDGDAAPDAGSGGAADGPLDAAPDTALEELLTEAIELLDGGDEAAVDELLAAHPDLAERAAEPLALLRGMGLVAETPGEPPLGGRVASYRLMRRLGEGGMGVVWLAMQESVGRLVALKLMRPELSASPAAAERFRREARAVARLSHPHIVSLYDAGEDRGVLWSAMALVPGEGLDERLAHPSRRPQVSQVLRWCADLAHALHAAHDEGVVHRDVKPANVRITPDDRAMLLDFGLARDADAASLTVTGSFQGSPAYAAPEQVEGLKHRIGPHTDVYALGVLLYEGVTGKVPFEGGTTEHVFHRILTGSPEPVRRQVRGLPRDLELVIEQAMEREPERRYASAAALAQDLEALLGFEPVAARPPGPWRRARRWVRGHPRVALAAGALLLAGLSFGLASLAESRRTEQERLDGAAAALADAERSVAALAQSRPEYQTLTTSVRRAEGELTRSWAGPEVWAAVDRDAARLAALEGTRRQVVNDALAAVARASRLAPEQAEALRGHERELALEQWRAARAAGQDERAADHARQAQRLDPEGIHAAELALMGTASLTSSPAGAEVFLFRYVLASDVVPGAGPRLVAEPVGGALAGVTAGTWALRPVAPSLSLRVDDRIVSVAGHALEGLVLVAEGDIQIPRHARLVEVAGQPVREVFDAEQRFGRGEAGDDVEWVFEYEGRRVTRRAGSLASLGVTFTDGRGAVAAGDVELELVRDGQRVSVTLTAGADTVPTASPLFIGPLAHAGVTPLADLPLREGSYVAVLRLARRNDVRVPFDVLAGRASSTGADLPEQEPGPPGFVLVAQRVDGVDTPFWIQEREVTSGEYLAFLNRQASADVINGSTVPVLYPRNSAMSEAGVSYWPLDGSGWFYLAEPNRPESPVYGVSLPDAQHYAAWLEERQPGWRFTVPSLAEVDAVRKVSAFRRYSHGEVFRPSWVSSYYARNQEWLPSVLTEPVDETPHGVFALTGSVSEWSSTPGTNELVFFYGGAFSYAEPPLFTNDTAFAVLPTRCESSRGFRLVARRAP
jgi:serine/threonine protein kinase